VLKARRRHKRQHLHKREYGCISMQRYWSTPRYSFLRTVFVGCRSTSSSNSRPPVPSFFCCVGVACPARGFCHSPRRFLACFYKSIYRHLGTYLSPLYCLICTVAAPPSIVVKCGGGGGGFFVWSFVVLFLSCHVLCGVVLVACLCV